MKFQPTAESVQSPHHKKEMFPRLQGTISLKAVSVSLAEHLVCKQHIEGLYNNKARTVCAVLFLQLECVYRLSLVCVCLVLCHFTRNLQHKTNKKIRQAFGMPLLGGSLSLIYVIPLVLVSFCINSLSYCRNWQAF